MLEMYTAEMEHQAASLIALSGVRLPVLAPAELRQVA